MDVVAEIGATEGELQGVVSSVEGTIEEKDSQLRELGVYRGYAEVFSRYVAAFQSEPGQLEPLKRATFLAWYELNEPPCFSGVNDLPKDARRAVMKLLKQSASNLDSEFLWMLAYYSALDPFAFPDLDSHPGLRSMLNSTDSNVWIRHRSEERRMHGRGLMGEYWRSVFGSNAV